MVLMDSSEIILSNEQKKNVHVEEIPYAIEAKTKFSNGYINPGYLQTVDNGYPLSMDFESIMCQMPNGTDGLFNMFKAHKFLVILDTKKLPLGAKITVMASLYWVKDCPGEIVDHDVSLSVLGNTTHDINHVQINPNTVLDKTIFTFYVTKSTRRSSKQHCFLHINFKIDNSTIILAKYFIRIHDGNYPAGKNFSKFFEQANFEIKSGVISVHKSR